VAAVIAPQEAGPDGATGAACERAATCSIRLSFQVRRSTCQMRDQACDVDGRARSRLHHMSAAACIGIMFVFMWYITQIDPLSVMTTRMIVKISAIIVQPPSDLPLMCRK
jgi:hypothetical protein